MRKASRNSEGGGLGVALLRGFWGGWGGGKKAEGTPEPPFLASVCRLESGLAASDQGYAPWGRKCGLSVVITLNQRGSLCRTRAIPVTIPPPFPESCDRTTLEITEKCGF